MSTAPVAQRDFSGRLRATPTKPGVYLMRDELGQVLYVGKASSLRHRLRSYFAGQSSLEPKIRNMVRKVADFDFILTESTKRRSSLRATSSSDTSLPITHALRTTRAYPFIKIDVSEDFPQVYITRRPPRDGARYFGPFASAYSVRSTLALLKKLFPYRSCTKTITGNDPRPCLDYYINRCVGPCIGAVNKEQYQEVIDQVIMFLEGKTDQVVKSLSARMGQAARRVEV